MAKFKPGQSGNPGGRLPGVPNKVTAAAKSRLEEIFEDVFTVEQIKEDLQGLNKRERMNAFFKLLEFLIPRQRATELRMDFEALSDQQLDFVIQSLLEANEQTGED